MITTYKLMEQIRQKKYVNMSNEELCEDYKKTQNQSILAEIFCKNFKLFNNLQFQPKYACIDKEDRVSSILTAINRALIKYKPDSGYVFNTFVITCIKTEFNGYLQHLLYAKRRGKAVSLDAIVEQHDDNEYEKHFKTPYTCFENSCDETELRLILQESNLDNKEIEVCNKLIEEDDISNTRLAELLHCHRHTIRNIKNELRKKLPIILYE